MKTVITGASGQDGIFLTNIILNNTPGNVYALTRKKNNFNIKKLKYLNKNFDTSRLHVVEIDYQNYNEVLKFFEDLKPNYIFNMMGPSSVNKFINSPNNMKNITIQSFDNLTNSLIETKNFCNFYQASSSEMYGYDSINPFDESSEFRPNSEYAKSKFQIHNKTLSLKEKYDWNIVSGIMFNHESEFRNNNFLIMRLIENVLEIKNGKNLNIKVPSLDIARDWTYAEEISNAAFQLTYNNLSGPYILGSGRCISLRDISSFLFDLVDLDYKNFVYENKSIMREGEPIKVLSNPKKIETEIGWKAKLDIFAIVEKMYKFKLNYENKL